MPKINPELRIPPVSPEVPPIFQVALKPSNIAQRIPQMAFAVLLVPAALTACAAGPHAGSAGSAQCPSTPVISSVFVDVTGSGFGPHIRQEYESAISSVATRAASCSGSISVDTFGSSSGQTVNLVQQSFAIEAPTENALVRKQEKLAAEMTATVMSQLDQAAALTPTSSTDVLGILRLFQETKAQHPDAMSEGLVLTDGFTNVDVDPAAAGSIEAAVALADQVAVPDLSGVKLTFAGIGRTTTAVPSSVIEQVTAFWKRVCERSNADSCTVVTKWQG